MAFFRNENDGNRDNICKVFKRMTQSEGVELLKKDQHATWLMRESMQPGMLTVDTKESSTRFGLTENGWQVVGYIMLNYIIVEPVPAELAATQAKALFIELEKIGLNTENQLIPPNPALASQAAYLASFMYESPQAQAPAKPNAPSKPPEAPKTFDPPGGPSLGPKSQLLSCPLLHE